MPIIAEEPIVDKSKGTELNKLVKLPNGKVKILKEVFKSRKQNDKSESSSSQTSKSNLEQKPILAYSSAMNKPVCLCIIWVHLQVNNN